MITDKLRSYAAARRQVMPAIEHRSHKGLNNRAENSHVPFAKARADDAGLPISGRPTAIHHRLLCRPQSHHATTVPPLGPCAHMHRLNAMAHWKAVAGVAA